MQDLIDQLAPNTVTTSPQNMARFLDDLQGAVVETPVAVFCPTSVGDVQKIMRWCAAENLTVVPQGGLTGLTQAAVPHAAGSVIVSLWRMSKIRDLDANGFSITVDAGVTLQAVRDAAEDVGCYFPLIHGAVGSSQIGGNLSTNSGGNNAVGYGTARDQVLGLEVVLPDGSVWNGLRALRKNTTGYDLKHSFIGAEGTLGIITGAVLKLRALPSNRVSGFLGVESPQQALDLFKLMQSYLGETISVFEFMSADAIALGLKAVGSRYPLETEGVWCLLVEAETSAKSFDLQGGFETGLEAAFEQGLLVDGVIAQSAAQRDGFWHLRESIAHMAIEDKSCFKSDTAVPIGQVPSYLKAAYAAVQDAIPTARSMPFGHLGDGNVHFNVLRPLDMDPSEFRTLWPLVARKIDQVSMDFGGTISAEHGIGFLKTDEFVEYGDPVGHAVMRRIKQALDPDGRMNPGVIFRDET